MSVTYPVYTSDPGGASIALSSGNIFQTVTDSSLAGTQSATSANGSVTQYTAGTYSLLRVHISANAATTSACTFKSNVAGSAGGQSVSVAHGTTGEFNDPSGTDTVSSGVFGVICNNGDGAGAVTVTIIAMAFSATTNTTKRIGCGTAAQAFGTASTTTYYLPCGLLANNTTEVNSQAKFYVTGTLTNLSVHLSANSRAQASTLGTRIGGSNGNLSISVTGSTTGEFHDTIDSDTLSNSGTTVSFFLTTGTGTGSNTLNAISVDLNTTDRTSVFATGLIGGASVGASTIKYTPVAGSMQGMIGTETYATFQAMAAYVITSMTANVTSNAASGGASTVRFRKGTGASQSNGNGAISITASTTGFFSDGSGSDTTASATEINYQIATASGGSVLFNTITAKLSQVPVGNGNVNLLMMMGCGT